MSTALRAIRRGDLWIVDFLPVEGHEQGGDPRPSVIVHSNNFDANVAELATVVPGTSKPQPRPLPATRYLIEPSSANGLNKPTYFLCDQIRTVSTKRFIDYRPMGRISAEDLFEIEEILVLYLDLGSKE